MNRRNLLGFGLFSLAVLVLTAFAPVASAGVVGTLVVSTCANGDVTVQTGTIVWTPPVGSGNEGCLQLAGGTNITSVGDGSLTGASGYGTINNLPGGEAGFMSFTTGGENLLFNLAIGTGFGPGNPTSCSSSPVPGNSCSVPGSPFILTSTATDGGSGVTDVNGTTVTLLANGTITDSNGTLSIWSGLFTTQLSNETPAQIQISEQTGGAIISGFSGYFTVSPVPEPVSMSLIGGGLLALAALKRRKRA
jgi:hypothetical protein